MDTVQQNNINTVINQKVDLYDRKDNPDAPTVVKERNSLNENFDNFLTLLTTQLRNQDPTNPVDNHEFTNQLVLFSGVEQQIRSNDYLEKLVDRLDQSSRESAVNYLGKEIEAEGNRFRVKHEGAPTALHYDLDEKASDVSVTILDSRGAAIATLTGEREKGDQFLTWDGRDASGNPVPAGTYSYRVTAVDASGDPIGVKKFTTVKIAGVGYENDEAYLISDSGDIYPISQVSALRDSDNSALQLRDILEAIKGTGDTNLLQYIGKKIETETLSVPVGPVPEDIHIRYDVDSSQGKSADFTVSDEQGNPVFKVSVDSSQGSHRLVWNGKNDKGQDVPAGTYRISISVADDKGDPQPTFVYIRDTIVSVNREGGTPRLVTASGREITPNDIARIIA